MNSKGEYGHIKSFVVRGGRFSKGQQSAYERLGKDLIIDFKDNDRFSFEKIFGNKMPVIIEIGFGSGTATAEIAEEKKDQNFLGIEVFKPGIGNLLKEIEMRKLSNVRIIEGDAYEIFRDKIPGNSLEGIHIFFPDPWPKKRHHKRRLVRPDFADFMTAALAPGGYIYFVTDWEDYAEHSKKVFEETDGLKNRYEKYAPPQSWRPVTRFHRKGEDQHHPIRELMFEKR